MLRTNLTHWPPHPFVVLLTGFAVIAGCGDSAVTQQSRRSALVGREFVSAKDWSGNGSSFSTPVTVRFAADATMTWQATCNTAGADVEIAVDRLIVGTISSTSMGCSSAGLSQDEDLSAFFEVNPRWQLNGRRLVLQSDSVDVTLRSTRVSTDVRGT